MCTRLMWGGAQIVGQLRVILVGVPPLLADMIYRVVSRRLQASGVKLSLADGSGAGTASRVVISLGLGGPPPDEPAVLFLSADLSRILGPGRHDVAPFTPDNLAARLLAIVGQG